METRTFQPVTQTKMNKPTMIKMTPKADKFDQLVDTLRRLMDEEFTGHLKINFSQGGIGRVEKFEEILRS